MPEGPFRSFCTKAIENGDVWCLQWVVDRSIESGNPEKGVVPKAIPDRHARTIAQQDTRPFIPILELIPVVQACVHGFQSAADLFVDVTGKVGFGGSSAS